jgi:septum formation inhibitor MinC
VYQHAVEAIEQLKAQITPLKTTNDEFASLARQLQEKITSLLEIVKEKDRQLQKLELIEHQYEQLKRLLYSRSSERSLTAIPGQLSLGIDAEMIEACKLNDGQKIESDTKHKAEKKKHPGRNEIPAHIERKYIDMHPDNLPEDAEHFDMQCCMANYMELRVTAGNKTLASISEKIYARKNRFQSLKSCLPWYEKRFPG